MKATGYLQIVPKRGSNGRVTALSIERVTSGPPYLPLSGAIVVKVELDVDERLLQPSVLEGKVPPGAATIVLEVKENDA